MKQKIQKIKNQEEQSMQIKKEENKNLQFSGHGGPLQSLITAGLGSLLQPFIACRFVPYQTHRTDRYLTP